MPHRLKDIIYKSGYDAEALESSRESESDLTTRTDDDKDDPVEDQIPLAGGVPYYGLRWTHGDDGKGSGYYPPLEVRQARDFYLARLNSYVETSIPSKLIDMSGTPTGKYLISSLTSMYKSHSSFNSLFDSIKNTKELMKEVSVPQAGHDGVWESLPESLHELRDSFGLDIKTKFIALDICPRRCYVYEPFGLKHGEEKILSCPHCAASRYKVEESGNGQFKITSIPASKLYIRSIFEIIADIMAHPTIAVLVRYGFDAWTKGQDDNKTFRDFWDAKFAQEDIPNILKPNVMHALCLIWIIATDGTQMTKKGKTVVPVVARLMNLPPWVRSQLSSNYLLAVMPPAATASDVVLGIDGKPTQRPWFGDSYDAILDVIAMQFAVLFFYGCTVKDAAADNKNVRVDGLLAAIINDARAHQHALGNAGPNAKHGADPVLNVTGYSTGGLGNDASYRATRYFSSLRFLKRPDATAGEKAILHKAKQLEKNNPDADHGQANPVITGMKTPEPTPWTREVIESQGIVTVTLLHSL